MKALSLYQPWATLVAIGAKKIETRSWYTHYRGPLMIHVTSNPRIEYSLLFEKYFKESLLGSLLKKTSAGVEFDMDQVHAGHMIAWCRLVTCLPVDIYNDKILHNETITYDDYSWTFSHQELYFGNYERGRFLWLLGDAHQIDPVPARGRQRLWNWTPPDDFIPF